jgi:LPS sulfotransferase NodH
MTTQFVIVGAARTGSTLLVRTLNSLDNICCHGELLAPEAVRGYDDGFDLLAASKSERDERSKRLLLARTRDPRGFILEALHSDNTATGFKALYSSFNDPRWPEVKATLLALPGLRFIHLIRRNNLRRYISEQILQSGGPNHSGAGGNSEKRLQVHIDIAAFLQNAAEMDAQTRHMQGLLADKAVLDIYYEELAADTPTSVSRVCQFLGMDTLPSAIEPALQKVGATDLRESVSNFQDLLDNPVTRAMALAD